jgi:hypothetical protein
MPFVKMPGVTGKVYVPETIPGQAQKHPCPDCFACQQCSDDRCTVCRSEGAVCQNGSPNLQPGSDSVRQCHHHRKQHQQKDKQAFK